MDVKRGVLCASKSYTALYEFEHQYENDSLKKAQKISGGTTKLLHRPTLSAKRKAFTAPSLGNALCQLASV
jgi:hypothetical protein